MHNPNVERGSTYTFKEGHPEVRVSALGLYDQQGNPGLNITTDIVYGSLIFKQKEGEYRSEVDLEIKIVKQDKSEEVVATRQSSFEITDSSQTIVNSQEVFNVQQRIEVEPGSYDIILAVTDQYSDKQTTRTTKASLPSADEEQPHITSIQTLGKNTQSAKSGYSPVTTYTVPKRIDSLTFRFQVTHNNPETTLQIESRLLRFKSDTTPARSLHFNNYTPSTIQYKGIDLDERTEIQKNTRRLRETGNILIEYKLATPNRGNYRFEARIPDQEEKIYKARDFGVKSKNYPTVESVRELARPLYYLMDRDKYEKMISFTSTDSIKKYMDRFWLENIESKNKARQVIEKYYERVEEANKQFSNFKEGWKTDPGYVYIMFGPPWYVEQSVDMMQWSYSYNRRDPEYNFVFHQPKMESEFYPFQHHILRRRNYYYNVEYQQRELWLSGRILNQSL